MSGGNDNEPVISVAEEEGDLFPYAGPIAQFLLQSHTVQKGTITGRSTRHPQPEDQVVMVVVDGDVLLRQAHGVVLLDLGQQQFIHLVHLDQELGGVGASVLQTGHELLLAIIGRKGVHHQERTAQDDGGQQQELQGQPRADGHDNAVRM